MPQGGTKYYLRHNFHTQNLPKITRSVLNKVTRFNWFRTLKMRLRSFSMLSYTVRPNLIQSKLSLEQSYRRAAKVRTGLSRTTSTARFRARFCLCRHFSSQAQLLLENVTGKRKGFAALSVSIFRANWISPKTRSTRSV